MRTPWGWLKWQLARRRARKALAAMQREMAQNMERLTEAAQVRACPHNWLYVGFTSDGRGPYSQYACTVCGRYQERRGFPASTSTAERETPKT